MAKRNFPTPVAASVRPLEPAVLSEMALQAAKELVSEGQSANTVASYQSALRYWAAWFALRYRSKIALPVAVPVVLQFIVDHAERVTDGQRRFELPELIDEALVLNGYKASMGALALNTLTHRIYVLSNAHRAKGLADRNPCADPAVKHLVAMTRRAYAKRGDTPAKKPALTREPLLALLQTCEDTLLGKRDRALLLFGWASGGRRRSEITLADMKFLQAQADGSYLYELTHTKTNQAGAGDASNFKPVTGIAAQALKDWLQAAQISQGAIFRRVLRGGHLGPPLTPAAVRDIVKKRASLAGLPGEFSAHSLRSGFVTEATSRGVPLAEMMAMTGHQSVQSLVGYARPMSRKVTNLLDGKNDLESESQ